MQETRQVSASGRSPVIVVTVAVGQTFVSDAKGLFVGWRCRFSSYARSPAGNCGARLEERRPLVEERGAPGGILGGDRGGGGASDPGRLLCVGAPPSVVHGTPAKGPEGPPKLHRGPCRERDCCCVARRSFLNAHRKAS